MPRSRRRIASALTLILTLGCTSVRTLDLTPDPSTLAEYLRANRIRDIRVTADTGPPVWLHAPQVHGDSLVGDAGRDLPPPYRAFELSHIVKLETAHQSAGKSAGFLLAVAVTVGAILTALVVAALHQAD